MKNRYTIFRCLTALMSVLVGMCGCSDELDGIRNAATRPSEVICFTASLKDSPASVSRSSAGHLEMEQEEWLVDTEKVTQISRGTPTTLLSGSAGVIGYAERLMDLPLGVNGPLRLPHGRDCIMRSMCLMEMN